ncbi:EI24 domain-containing protein [Oscillatoria sp. CS-180]|uniref:EI24 domain-containing protein n=1 Tax=Oscillatoria sp. CS-180 TaxID=3021720 RepID=UPI00232DB558|nr:EI24 domain-containing protein [Oscillatoria sp. CS-180]MDB9524715.1 EI24 domain-containing protein [Oscillatoria sp. CS-180]
MEQPNASRRLRPRGGGLPGLFIGFSYPLRALRLFQKHKALRPYVIAPLGINILLGMALYSLGTWQGLKLVNRLTTRLIEWIEPTWLDTAVQLLSPLIQGTLIVLLFIVLGFVLLQFGGILGSPFYGQLSEKIEILRTGKLEVPPSLGGAAVLVDIWRAIMFEIKKLILLAIIGIPILLLNFVPGVGTIAATVSSIALASLLICLDMFDASLERRRLKFRQKLKLVLGTLPASGGFALICLGLISIPLMNLLAIPLCVSAGTLFFCDRILESSQAHSP